MLTNNDGKIFVGSRKDGKRSNYPDAWQMPQGGIDDGEDAKSAALRELKEETGIDAVHVNIIATSAEERFYDLPEELVGKIWKGKYRGQRQWWFLLRFSGEDHHIDVNTDHAEFSNWKWVEPDDLPRLIVPFKKELYKSVLAEFETLI
jgi:putative (di)nucleoside polyphosphate hydrolase